MSMDGKTNIEHTYTKMSDNHKHKEMKKSLGDEGEWMLMALL